MDLRSIAMFLRAPVAICLLLVPSTTMSQERLAAHRAAANQLIDAALRDCAAYARLTVLVDRFGHRISGSASLERAIDWIVAEMKADGLENVRSEPVTVYSSDWMARVFSLP